MRKNISSGTASRAAMRFECVKGPFVNALPMTLSGIVKGINTLRARNRQSFSFFFSRFFFLSEPHRHRRSERKTNAGTRSIGCRCVYPFFSVFRCILYAFYRPSVTSKPRKIAWPSTYTVGNTYGLVFLPQFADYFFPIIIFSSYSFCYELNFETWIKNI